MTASRGRAIRLFLLQFGAERVPRGLSLRGGDGLLGWEPLTGVLVETPTGWVLLDTGMARAAHDDPANDIPYTSSADAYGHDDGNAAAPHLHPLPPPGTNWTWGLPGDPAVTALAAHGLAPSDLSLAAISHLHLDHSGGIPALARANVPIAIQKAELDFTAGGTVGLADGFRREDWQDQPVDWRLVEGDAELAPGVWAMSTPGHTPGHMSFRVELPETGTWIFPADAADLAENVRTLSPPGSAQGDDPERAAALALDSVHRLAREAAHRDARVVPGHDQVVVNAARHPPGGHR